MRRHALLFAISVTLMMVAVTPAAALESGQDAGARPESDFAGPDTHRDPLAGPELAPALAAADPTDVIAEEVLEVIAGRGHSCAVTVSGAGWCWGYNAFGQLGNGTTVDTPLPSPVLLPLGRRLIQISPSYNHTCAVSEIGTILCWGENTYGQLGNGTTSSSSTPVEVFPLSAAGFVHVSTGGNHSCGVTANGFVYCWGINDAGQLGDGTATTRTVPTLVSSGAGLLQGTVASVDAGTSHTCALSINTRAYCWGYNFYGQLGDGTATNRFAPVVVQGALATGGVIDLDAAGSGSHTCAVAATLVAYCWGHNNHGQLGDGSTTDRSTPTPVGQGTGLTPGTVREVSAGEYSTCAATIVATAFCWGWNVKGEVGDGTTTQRNAPVAVNQATGFEGVRSLGAGGNAHNCGVTLSGKAYCWGYNLWGQIGDGTHIDRTTPARVLLADLL